MDLLLTIIAWIVLVVIGGVFALATVMAIVDNWRDIPGFVFAICAMLALAWAIFWLFM